MILLAEVPNELVVVLNAVMLAIGGAAAWLVKTMFEYRALRKSEEERHRLEEKTDRKDKQKSIVEHLEMTLRRQQAELDKHKAHSDSVQVILMQTLAHVGYLEGIMYSKDIDFEPLRIKLDQTVTDTGLRRALNLDGTRPANTDGGGP